MRVRRTISTLILTLLLVACGGNNQSATGPEIGSTPGKALATVWLSPTPPGPAIVSEPTFTAAPTLPLPTLPAAQATLPIGTAGPLQQNQSAPGTPGTPSAILNCTVPEPFSGPWLANTVVQERLGCPAGTPQQRLAAFQPFEHGYMIWVQSEGSIYVLSNKSIQQGQETDTWWRLEDTFAEGDPAIDEGLFPPEGLLQPQRGFGKIWRNNGFVREAVGWALAGEEGYDTTWLNFEHGWMMTSPNIEPIFVLVPEDDPPYNTGVHLGPQLSIISPGTPADSP
jgi:hypothetical protein